MIAAALLAVILAQVGLPPSFSPADVVSVERYNEDFDLVRLRAGPTRLVPTAAALQKLVTLGIQLDQARDDLAAARETAGATAKEQELRQQLIEALKGRLEDEKRHSDQVLAMAKAQQEGFGGTLAELRARADAEAAAKDKVIAKLKGNAFFNAIKTGAKIGVGIGIGIAIARLMP